MFDGNSDSIAAVATGSGGAISVIRVSGAEALRVCDAIFRPVSGKDLSVAKGYTIHYGAIVDGDEVVDDVLVSVFRAPRSYTGEDMAEISCHGSAYIRGRIMSLLTGAGARPAGPGEFTMRAYMAGKMDLSQAEAVADIIASEDRASHAMAVNQMKGGYSADLQSLRAGLVELASLLELELDFSEEDVEFADRGRLLGQIDAISAKIEELKESFLLNNTIRQGIPVTIAGEPNTGKSTLLNALLREDRAMVSDIAGTTRDVIEESMVIDGVRFRFTDTAGLRDTDDTLENMGIERARTAISRASVLLYVLSPDSSGNYPVSEAVAKISTLKLDGGTKVFLLLNKSDKLTAPAPDIAQIVSTVNSVPAMAAVGRTVDEVFLISARTGDGIAALTDALSGLVDREKIYGGGTVVTNARHYEALLRSGEALGRAKDGLASGIPADLLSGDIRDSLHFIGLITGEVSNSEILNTIFSSFCIGK